VLFASEKHRIAHLLNPYNRNPVNIYYYGPTEIVLVYHQLAACCKYYTPLVKCCYDITYVNMVLMFVMSMIMMMIIILPMVSITVVLIDITPIFITNNIIQCCVYSSASLQTWSSPK
jgi:hypothetical protein